MQRAVAKQVSRPVKRRSPAPVAPAGGESKEKLTRFDADVWGGISLYAKTAGLNDTQAINDLLRIALRAVATSGKPDDVYSAPTVALPSGGDETRTVLLLETMERMLCTSIGLLADLGERGRPPRVSAENRAYAKRVRDDCRMLAEKAVRQELREGAA